MNKYVVRNLKRLEDRYFERYDDAYHCFLAICFFFPLEEVILEAINGGSLRKADKNKRF